MCHENEKGIYGDNAQRCFELLEAFPQMDGIFDPANFVQCGQDTSEAWKLLRDRIKYLHIKDALADGKVVPAGKGIGNVRAILDDFRARGGNAVTIEPHLSVFAGLKDLERAGEETKIDLFTYESSDAAFDEACNALKALLQGGSTMDKKIRLGIIGIGNMGSGHACRVVDGECPDFLLTAVADTNPAREHWAKKRLGEHVAFFHTAQEMLDSSLIDACIVATPHYDHPGLAIECMERSIHVMVEKPAGVYTKQARGMMDVADQHPEVVFGMMFNQRTNHVYRKARELVQSGKYGRIRRTNWIITDWYRTQHYYDSGAWRATWAGEGGGVLLNQCPHQLDLWQWICSMPVKVQTHMKFGQWHDIEVEDDVTTYVEYENGATGVFVTTTGDVHGTNRIEIQMDKAKIVVTYGGIELKEFSVSEPEWTATCKEVTLPIDEDLFKEELMKRVTTSRHRATPAQPAEVIDLSSTYGGGK